MNNRLTCVTGLQAIAAGFGISLRIQAQLMSSDGMFVETVQDNHNNYCSLHYWHEKGEWKSKIGWYSSSSQDKGPEPCETMIRHMNCAVAMHRYLQASVQD